VEFFWSVAVKEKERHLEFGAKFLRLVSWLRKDAMEDNRKTLRVFIDYHDVCARNGVKYDLSPIRWTTEEKVCRQEGIGMLKSLGLQEMPVSLKFFEVTENHDA
jgi:hypothetical protein